MIHLVTASSTLLFRDKTEIDQLAFSRSDSSQLMGRDPKTGHGLVLILNANNKIQLTV